MQPVLVHYCTACTYQSPVPFSASVFSQIQTCTHCGVATSGINLPPPSPPPEVQDANAMQQEELARLFSHNLTLSQPPPEPTPFVEVQGQTEKQPTAPHQPVTYVSQHYHHSWHAVPKSAPASVTCHTDNVDSELETILARNSIDPSSLLPTQINLFRNADDGQRLRLLELWRISPPTRGEHELGRETSLQNEERMAELRYEKLMRERERLHHEHQFHMQDQAMATESPAVQAVYNHSHLSGSPEDTQRQAEPYILSGYEMLAKREYEDQALRDSTRYNQSTDPVYKTTPNTGIWSKPGLQDMENQYGAFAMMREYEGVSQPAVHELDQEMMM